MRDFARVASVEVQCIMRFGGVSDTLRLARCSKRFFRDASHAFAWATTYAFADTEVSRVARSLLRFAPTCITLTRASVDVSAVCALRCTGVHVLTSEALPALLLLLPALDHVRVLVFPRTFVVSHAQLAEVAAAWPYVDNLTLDACLAYHTLTHFPTLRTLTLACTYVHDELARACAQLPHLQRLKLVAADAHLQRDSEAVDVFARVAFPSVTCLQLVDMRSTAWHRMWPRFPAVACLDLAMCHAPRAIVQSILDDVSALPRLRVLQIDCSDACADAHVSTSDVHAARPLVRVHMTRDRFASAPVRDMAGVFFLLAGAFLTTWAVARTLPPVSPAGASLTAGVAASVWFFTRSMHLRTACVRVLLVLLNVLVAAAVLRIDAPRYDTQVRAHASVLQAGCVMLGVALHCALTEGTGSSRHVFVVLYALCVVLSLPMPPDMDHAIGFVQRITQFLVTTALTTVVLLRVRRASSDNALVVATRAFCNCVPVLCLLL
jgi:hypothetical protein